MNVSEFAVKLGARILTGETGEANAAGKVAMSSDVTTSSEVVMAEEDVQLKGIYCCDLLSWVMSHAAKGTAWITVHTHLNIVAVASLIELSCIIVPEGIEVEAATIKRAVLEGVPIISTGLSAYQVCCIAFECGL